MIQRLDVKIVLALFATVMVPLGFSVYLVAESTETSLGLGLNKELASQLKYALQLQRTRIAEKKSSVTARFEHLRDSHDLALVASIGDAAAVRAMLRLFVEKDPELQMVRLRGDSIPSVEYRQPIEMKPESARALSFSDEVLMHPFNKIEADFAVDASIMQEYEKAGSNFATYMALVEAPPDYLANRFVWVYLSILGVAVVLSIVMGVLWTRRLARRIHELSEATTLVAQGDLAVHVHPGPDDEVGQLVDSFNQMVAELSLSRTRIEYLQKISAWQEMARRLAHEIKNPLTPIQLAAQQLKEKYKGEDAKFGRLLEQSTEIIKEEVATLRRLTSDFSSFARLPEVQPELVELSEFLEECEASLAPVTEQEGVTITFDTRTEGQSLYIDRIMFKRVIDNLVRNAAESLKEAHTQKPRIDVKTVREKRGKVMELEIRVEDNGPGIPEANRNTIFDPYFTTKSDGTGLGLAISKKIVLEHGGSIWIDEEFKRGTAVVVALPALQQD